MESKVWYNKLEMISGEIIKEDDKSIILRRRDGIVEIFKTDINRIERGI
jgi:hypothetical protein